MRTIAHITEDIIKRSPYLQEGMSEGLINYSALARKIKGDIDKKLYKHVTEAAIIMALRRLQQRLRTRPASASRHLKHIGEITVRSHLVEYALHNSPATSRLVQAITTRAQRNDGFCNISQGVSETSIILSASLEPALKAICKKPDLIKHLDHLASITIKFSSQTVDTPGVYYLILKALAWEGINFIEITSSYSELSIFFAEQDVDRAFSVIKQLTDSTVR